MTTTKHRPLRQEPAVSAKAHQHHRHPEARRYVKVVRWSEEDQVFVGSCPPIIGESCHGDTEAEVIDQLVIIVDEWLDIFKADGTALPPGTNNGHVSIDRSQAAATARARKIRPNAKPEAARVRRTSRRKPDQLKKA